MRIIRQNQEKSMRFLRVEIQERVGVVTEKSGRSNGEG